MINQLRNIFLFLRYIALIYRNRAGFDRQVRSLLFLDYVKFCLLDMFPSFLKSKISKLRFLGHMLYFSDLHSTVKLIESIFIDLEYYFDSKKVKPKIVDLGSNVGISVIYFKYAYPNCQIMAFEPDPETAMILSKNVKSYCLSNTTIYNEAVSDSTGFTNFYINRQSVGSPLMSTSPLRIEDSRKIKVPSVKLSSHINSSIDLLKMDIEGSERKVLSDLTKTKKIKLVKELCIEYHHHIVPKVDNLSVFLNILEKNNFGYQINAGQKPPYIFGSYEDIAIHAYQK